MADEQNQGNADGRKEALLAEEEEFQPNYEAESDTELDESNTVTFNFANAFNQEVKGLKDNYLRERGNTPTPEGKDADMETAKKLTDYENRMTQQAGLKAFTEAEFELQKGKDLYVKLQEAEKIAAGLKKALADTQRGNSQEKQALERKVKELDVLRRQIDDHKKAEAKRQAEEHLRDRRQREDDERREMQIRKQRNKEKEFYEGKNAELGQRLQESEQSKHDLRAQLRETRESKKWVDQALSEKEEELKRLRKLKDEYEERSEGPSRARKLPMEPQQPRSSSYAEETTPATRIMKREGSDGSPQYFTPGHGKAPSPVETSTPLVLGNGNAPTPVRSGASTHMVLGNGNAPDPVRSSTQFNTPFPPTVKQAWTTGNTGDTSRYVEQRLGDQDKQLFTSTLAHRQGTSVPPAYTSPAVTNTGSARVQVFSAAKVNGEPCMVKLDTSITEHVMGVRVAERLLKQQGCSREAIVETVMELLHGNGHMTATVSIDVHKYEETTIDMRVVREPSFSERVVLASLDEFPVIVRATTGLGTGTLSTSLNASRSVSINKYQGLVWGTKKLLLPATPELKLLLDALSTPSGLLRLPYVDLHMTIEYEENKRNHTSKLIPTATTLLLNPNKDNMWSGEKSSKNVVKWLTELCDLVLISNPGQTALTHSDGELLLKVMEAHMVQKSPAAMFLKSHHNSDAAQFDQFPFNSALVALLHRFVTARRSDDDSLNAAKAVRQRLNEDILSVVERLEVALGDLKLPYEGYNFHKLFNAALPDRSPSHEHYLQMMMLWDDQSPSQIKIKTWAQREAAVRTGAASDRPTNDTSAPQTNATVAAVYEEGVSPCYRCNNPGHQAKDCKMGDGPRVRASICTKYGCRAGPDEHIYTKKTCWDDRTEKQGEKRKAEPVVEVKQQKPTTKPAADPNPEANVAKSRNKHKCTNCKKFVHHKSEDCKGLAKKN